MYLKTNLPDSPHLYGLGMCSTTSRTNSSTLEADIVLGEHSDPFMLNTTNYTRPIWTRDAYGVPMGENLYGAHPIYFDHRTSGTHGVFLVGENADLCPPLC